MFKNFNLKNRNSGFTIVEALVAITILLIAVVGPLSLLSIALRDSIYIRNEITANYLAQEGLEVITYFSETGNLVTPGVYCIDGTEEGFSQAVFAGDEDSCRVQLFGTSPDLYYGHDRGGENTIFTRYVTVQGLNNSLANDAGGEEYKITSTVKWNNSGRLVGNARSIVYETHLFVDQ